MEGTVEISPKYAPAGARHIALPKRTIIISVSGIVLVLGEQSMRIVFSLHPLPKLN